MGPVGGQPAAMNPSYFSRSSVQNGDPLSPQYKGGDATGQSAQSGIQSSRNMSMLNIKKSSARFLSPLHNQGANKADMAGITNFPPSVSAAAKQPA